LIASQTEYLRAREELEYLNDWLSRLEDKNATPHKAITSASVRKMIARLQEELAEYEAASVSSSPAFEERTDLDSGSDDKNMHS
jgi:BMFP domain-containing protein YqiC